MEEMISRSSVKGKISVFVIGLLLTSSMLVAVGGEAYEDESEVGETLFASGSGTEDDPYLIENVYQLQDMKENLSAHYKLVTDIDATETEGWNDGKGFELYCLQKISSRFK